MSDYDKSIHNNPDAQAWAKFFISTVEEQSWRIEDIDESLMTGWFANAMMAMHDHVKKEWVGLTEKDKDELVESLPDFYSVEGVIATVAAKLKEKNGG